MSKRGAPQKKAWKSAENAPPAPVETPSVTVADTAPVTDDAPVVENIDSPVAPVAEVLTEVLPETPAEIATESAMEQTTQAPPEAPESAPVELPEDVPTVPEASPAEDTFALSEPEPEPETTIVAAEGFMDAGAAEPEVPEPAVDPEPVADVPEIVEPMEAVEAPETGEAAAVPEVTTATEAPELPVAAAVAATAEVVERANDTTEAVGPDAALHTVEPLPDESVAPEAAAATSASEAAPHSEPGRVATSFAAKCFDFLAVLGPVAALIFLVAQVVPGFGLRTMWFPGFEADVASGVSALQQVTGMLMFTVSSAQIANMPPVYFWFLSGLQQLWMLTPVPLDVPMLVFAGTAVSAGVLLVVTWIMARLCCGNRTEAFAACAVLLSSVVFCLAARMAVPDLLFAACVLLSCCFLYVGYVKTSAPLSLLLGYLLAGVAVLINGLLGIIVPLAASFLFLMWRGTFRRAGARDGAFGFFVMLAVFGGALAWVGLTYGREPLEALMRFGLGQWSFALLQSPDLLLQCAIGTLVVLMPWTLLVLFLPWERVYRLPVALWRTRTEAPGVGFVWCATLVTLVCVVFSSGPFPVLLVFLPFLSILVGRAVTRLSPGRSRVYFALIGVLLFVLALVVGLCTLLPVVAPWLPFDVSAAVYPDITKIAALPGMIFVAAGALLFAFVLLKCTDKRIPRGGLLVVLLCVTALLAPVNLLMLPVVGGVGKGAVEVPVTAPAQSAPAETPAVPVASPAAAETPAAPAETPATAPEASTPPAETPVAAEPSAPAEAPATPADPPVAPAAAAPAVEAPATPAEAPAEPAATPGDTPAAPANPS